MPVYNHYWLDRQGRVGSPESVFNLTLQGPVLPVLVSVTSQYAQLLQRLNRSVPSPVPGYALLDTGAALCSVDREVIRGLGVPPFGYAMTQGATHPSPIPTLTFPASLSFPNTPLPNITFLNFVALPLRAQGIIALIGRSVLRDFVMTYNGPAAMITLSF